MSRPAVPLLLDDWPVAILAGGLATRLRPLTETLPKALITVADEPFLAHQLRLLRSRGIRRVVLCLGYLGDMVEQQFRDGDQYGIKIEYSFDGPQLLGTGGALKRALPMLNRQFFVLYGDSYLPIEYGSVARAFCDSGKPALMTVFKNDGRWDSSNVDFRGEEIRRYDKETRTEDMRYIDYGLGVFRREALANWPDDRAFDLADVYRDLTERKQLAGFEVKQRFYEIGSAGGLAELDSLLRKPLAGSQA
jgi:NDP-sugar pyrophosphorylase family protein